MAEESKDQKTEEASSRRVRQTEERGQFALSREFTQTIILLASILAFNMSGLQSTKNMMDAWHTLLGESHAVQATPPEMQKLLIWTLVKMGAILAPILLAIMAAGIFANLIQTQGFKFSLHPLQPNFGKLDPIKGMTRIFSKSGLVELFKSLFKIAAVSLVAYITIKGRFDELPALMSFPVGRIMTYMGEVGSEIMVKVLLMMMVLAGLDYAFQRFTYQENIRMTKQEVKDERKETEGNPLVKQRIRSAQMQMARRRMMAAVPKADVVVTNPTHIAVAIKYDSSKHDVPVVVAKGQGYVAQKIREIAKNSGIPMVEDKPLARTLFKTVEIGQYIPATLYKAVAEILAYVYRLKGKFTV
ncbi:MAG: flagellar biosynthesis protein FlhB [Nitrospinae bacterium]|nr:flagellar biosynthesis protein FlhB [Nitrospinota bacterium]